ncbi:MAG: hypothetical protein K1060chlam3_00116 [Candidatus Anoxychlamydiales bacterium]|nr:hypothetical protein [Candidatus Anoxychlamydiales bacterium]
MSVYQKNLKILSEKFPLIYMLLLTKSANSSSLLLKRKASKKNKFEGSKDSKTFDFLKKPLKELDVIYIYKCKNHPFLLELKKWLKKKDKKLIFIEDRLQDLQSFFNFDIANTFLNSENVDIHFVQNIRKDLQGIVTKSLSTNIEVITFENFSKKFLNFKEKILKNSLINFYSTHDSLYSHKLFKNFIKNLGVLKSSFLVNKFKDKFKNRPAIILGAGPSLNYSYEKLKTLSNKALIIAGGSAITSLTNQNISPHLAVAIDPNFEEFKRLKNALSFEIPLLYSTRVNSGVFSAFNGDLGYIKAGINSFFEVFLEQELKILGKYLKTKPDNMAMSVTTICLSLAKLFGCNPIIIDGVDLAFSENKLYASSITKNNKLDTSKTDIGDEPLILKDKNNQDIYSNLKWKIERDWISIFAKNSKGIKFFNSTRSGLKIDNFEDTTLEAIEKKYLDEDFDFKGYIHTLSQNYMLTQAKKVDFKALKLKLKNSFLRSQSYLEDIIKNDPEYKAILAQEELKDEIAYKYFLFEIDFNLSKFYDSKKTSQKLLDLTQLFLNEL